MQYDVEHLPDDAQQLKAIIVSLLESDAANRKTLNELVAEVSRLNLRIEQLLEMVFGKKSEKLLKNKAKDEPDTNDSSKSPEPATPPAPPAEEPQNSIPKKTRKKKTKNGGGGRMVIPPDLPVRIVEILPPPEERTCTECDAEFKRIGKSVSRRIIYIPPVFEVEETHIIAFAGNCPCSDCKIAKPEPAIKPIDKGLVSTSLLVIMVIMKYVDHLPLARQASRVFLRSGLKFSPSSMCRWMKRAAELLEPLYELIIELILESERMQFDATFVKYRDENVQGRCKQGYVYGTKGDDTRPFDLFFFRRDGTRSSIEGFLTRYHGVLQVDANSVYDGIFKPVDPKAAAPTEQGCWAHARRKFKTALRNQPDAVIVLNWIGELYGVEREAKKMTPMERLRLRQERSVLILDKIFQWCRENREKYLPKEEISTAIEYFLNNEDALVIYCTNGKLEIDNNALERMIRCLAVGRKNWLFFGNAGGGETASILYTILCSARRHGHNEFEYLCDVLDRLADLSSRAELRELLPDRWKPRDSS